MYDFNLIVEEYPFYQMLTPKMQTSLINTIFKDFKQQFIHFFGPCEQGFVNECIISLYTRSYMPGREVIYESMKISQIFFIVEGQVQMSNKHAGQFMVLNEKAVFGDYMSLFHLKSNISFRTLSDPTAVDESFMYINNEYKTQFMCIRSDVFL